MRISINRPSMTWVVGGTGVTVLTSTSYLTDGLVVKPARFTWPTGSQTTSTTMTLQATLGASTVIRAAGLLCPLSTGFAFPAGMKITVDSGLGGNALTQRTVQLSDGSVGIYYAFPAGSPVTTITFTLYNDVNGSTYFTAGQIIDIGEAWAADASDWKIAPNIEAGLADTLLMRRSHSEQPWPLYRKPYTSDVFSFVPMRDKAVFDPTTSPSYLQMRYQLSLATAALIFPRVYVPGSTTTIDTVALHQLAVFGRPDSLEAVKGTGDPYWTAKMTFSAAPP